MNTNAEDRDINQVNRTIHEWMGRGSNWHVLDRYVIAVEYIDCATCDETLMEHLDNNPDYTSSLDAVAEAEKKAVEEFGRSEYYGHLEYQVGVDDLFAKYWVVTATALQRATAIFNLITENK